MSTMWSVIGRTARGDVLTVTPRIDAVSFVDNSRTDITERVFACRVSRDFKSGLTGSLRVSKGLNDGEFWTGHAINPSLVVRTRTGMSQVKLGLLYCRSMTESYRDVSLTLGDVLALHRQPQLVPFNTAPADVTPTVSKTSPEAALSRIRELTTSSNLVGAIDHRGFEPTTLLNPNPDISSSDSIAVRAYAAGSELLCELELLLKELDWRPPWTTRRGLVTSEPYCSPCDVAMRTNAALLPDEVVREETFKVSTNLMAPNTLRVRDSNGDSAIRTLADDEPYSSAVVGRAIPQFIEARNPANNVDQFWSSLRAPRRKVSFRCASPGVFWHRDVFKLSFGGLSDEICVVSRWSLDLLSTVYTVEADICGGA